MGGGKYVSNGLATNYYCCLCATFLKLRLPYSLGDLFILVHACSSCHWRGSYSFLSRWHTSRRVPQYFPPSTSTLAAQLFEESVIDQQNTISNACQRWLLFCKWKRDRGLVYVLWPLHELSQSTHLPLFALSVAQSDHHPLLMAKCKWGKRKWVERNWVDPSPKP